MKLKTDTLIGFTNGFLLFKNFRSVLGEDCNLYITNGNPKKVVLGNFGKYISFGVFPGLDLQYVLGTKSSQFTSGTIEGTSVNQQITIKCKSVLGVGEPTTDDHQSYNVFMFINFENRLDNPNTGIYPVVPTSETIIIPNAHNSL